MRRQSARGFTLIEMMVVVAIIGLLAIFFVSLSARTFGSNADSIADEVSATLNFAHTRAVSTRRYHCAEIKAQQVILYQSKTTGMATPANACPNAASWDLLQKLPIPTGTTVVDEQATTYNTAGVATGIGSGSGALDAIILFKPDGSSNAGTIFLGDGTGTRKDRVILYPATGNVYVRKAW